MPFRRCQNTAFPAALEYLWRWVGGMTHIHQYALETGCTLRFRHVFQRRQQLGIIGTVALAEAIIRSGIAGAVNSGRALQGIDFKTGIIGQCRQTGGSAGITCFEDGVFNKTEAGFFGLNHIKLSLRNQLNILLSKVGIEQG